MAFPLINRLKGLHCKKTKPLIETARIALCLPEHRMSRAFLEYYAKNRAHLKPWEAQKEPSFYTISQFKDMINIVHQLFEQDAAVRLVVMDKSQSKIIGICNFTSITRGIAQSCYLGYAIDEDFQGQGYMKEAADAAVNYMFSEFQMHRVMANYMPHNLKSGALLESIGFIKEGYAKAYLKVDGLWQDHILTAKIAP